MKNINRELYIIAILSLITSLIVNKLLGTFDVDSIIVIFLMQFFLSSILDCLISEVELSFSKLSKFFKESRYMVESNKRVEKKDKKLSDISMAVSKKRRSIRPIKHRKKSKNVIKLSRKKKKK